MERRAFGAGVARKQRSGSLTRTFMAERVTGIEPASPAWKAGALAIELHPRTEGNGIRVRVRAGARVGRAVRNDMNT